MSSNTAEGPGVEDLPIVDPGPEAESIPAATTVEVKPTGHVRREIGLAEFRLAFGGDTLEAFLEALFERYPGTEELLIAETEAEASTDGWADPPGELPGTLHGNPAEDDTRAYARVLVDGRFNELYDGFHTELDDGDRVALVYPFIYCC